jgi:UDP-N-acetylmuramoylalanine--D-glutamate ligase
MHIHELYDKHVAIWGAGREGLATLKVLKKRSVERPITILNDSPLSTSAQHTLKEIDPTILLITGDKVASSLSQFDVIIKSPGVNRYRSDIIAAKQKKTFFTSSTQLWFNEHASEKIIAITGTKGKSTTASLIHHMLNQLGFNAILGGNIGDPIISKIDIKPIPDYWVIEMSSYQTSEFIGDVSAAVLLNLYPEHLDWHGDEKTYYYDKLNLFAQIRTGHSIINATDPNTQALSFNWKNPIYFNAEQGIHLKNGIVHDGKTPLVPTHDIKLLGQHNLSNLCAALTTIKSLGISPTDSIQTLGSFQGLPHRLQLLGKRNNGLLFIDDSIATIPQATISALSAVKETFPNRPITLLAGGFDRGIAVYPLIDYLIHHPIHALITMPDSGKKIAKAFQKATINTTNTTQLFETNNLESAVRIAKQITPTFGIVLLSPAAPSYHAFKDFNERGQMFEKFALTI